MKVDQKHTRYATGLAYVLLTEHQQACLSLSKELVVSPLVINRWYNHFLFTSRIYYGWIISLAQNLL